MKRFGMRTGAVAIAAVLLFFTVTAMAGTTFGFILQPTPGYAGLQFVPAVVGLQYEGQYGFGFGVEFFKAPFVIDWYGDYWVHEYLTVDLPDGRFIEAGVYQRIMIVDMDPGVFVDMDLWGNVGYGVGAWGHSVRADVLYSFDDLTNLRLQLGARVDLFGLIRQIKLAWGDDEPDTVEEVPDE